MSSNQRVAKKRRGPKAKSISERILRERSLNPIVRIKQTYSQRQKIRVLTFLEHYQLLLGTSGTFRTPTQQEAEDRFNIPRRTISEWARKKTEIETAGINTCRRAQAPGGGNETQCWWPELEEKLYKDFLESRGQ